jgi:hypothetical protein
MYGLMHYLTTIRVVFKVGDEIKIMKTIQMNQKYFGNDLLKIKEKYYM